MEALDSTADSAAQARFEQGLIEVFGGLAELFGNPRSHGQIYGLLFSAREPLLMEDITKRVGISMGAVSQGLRALEDMAIVEREVRGRFGYYTAKLELKTLINGFIRQRLIPRLEKSTATLKDLSSLLAEMSPEEADEAGWRLKRVAQWHTRAALFLPLAEKILQSKTVEKRLSRVPEK
jgi:DNA-binding transcriptional regulator GbsR (MarR family)